MLLPFQTSALFQSSIREGIKHYYDDLDFKNILDYVQQKVVPCFLEDMDKLDVIMDVFKIVYFFIFEDNKGHELYAGIGNIMILNQFTDLFIFILYAVNNVMLINPKRQNSAARAVQNQDSLQHTRYLVVQLYTFSR